MTLVEEASDVQNTIIECIDESLKELGQSVRKVVYFHLEKNFGINKNEIPVQPKTFCQALQSIFGEGANVIEGLIVQKIQKKFKLLLEPETSLAAAIERVKNAT